VAEHEQETPDAEAAVTAAELRNAALPLQAFGGYSRAETSRLLERAATTLEAQIASLKAMRADAEREAAELHAEARRVRSVIDDFRAQWRKLISEAVEQLELRSPSPAVAVEAEALSGDLGSRLADPHPEGRPQPHKHVDVDSPLAPGLASAGEVASR
jgi:chromosome segregation ATPase